MQNHTPIAMEKTIMWMDCEEFRRKSTDWLMGKMPNVQCNFTAFFCLFDWCNSLPREFQFFFLVGTLNGYSHTCRFERAFCEIFVHSKRFFLFLLVCNTQKNGCENGLVTVMMLLWWYANWQLIDKIAGYSETQVSYTLRFETWWASKKLRFQC